MASFTWDPQKNESLIRERHISFEVILWSIQAEGLLDMQLIPTPPNIPAKKFSS